MGCLSGHISTRHKTASKYSTVIYSDSDGADVKHGQYTVPMWVSKTANPRYIQDPFDLRHNLAGGCSAAGCLVNPC